MALLFPSASFNPPGANNVMPTFLVQEKIERIGSKALRIQPEQWHCSVCMEWGPHSGLGGSQGHSYTQPHHIMESQKLFTSSNVLVALWWTWTVWKTPVEICGQDTLWRHFLPTQIHSVCAICMSKFFFLSSISNFWLLGLVDISGNKCPKGQARGDVRLDLLQSLLQSTVSLPARWPLQWCLSSLALLPSYAQRAKCHTRKFL